MGLRGLRLALVVGVVAVCTPAISAVDSPGVTIQTLRVPHGFRASPGTIAEPYTATGWVQSIVHERTGIEMVFIPAGEFIMGRNWLRDEKPLHRVRITQPFYMGKCEVTQGQWRSITGNNPSHFQGDDLRPVESVSRDDCQQFLTKAGGGLRLPTEAEWEYACRAGSSATYSFGKDAHLFGEYAWTDDRDGNTHEVGRKKPNGWGLHDMHGNVCEWCSDWYDAAYYQASPESDPPGPATGEYCVVRGGSWFCDIGFCASCYRSFVKPDVRFATVGFRVVLGLDR
jgi:formylglycine-generating enzyme required for sulfatase activity